MTRGWFLRQFLWGIPMGISYTLLLSVFDVRQGTGKSLLVLFALTSVSVMSSIATTYESAGGDE